MIKKLDNRDIQVAKDIRAVFQASYKVEAELLKAKDFPPLKRPLEKFTNSATVFFGYIKDHELAGIIEIEHCEDYTDINSLVVDPKYFRQGIAKALIEFIFRNYNSDLFTVETGLANGPATALYRKLGFKEVRQWDTDFEVRKVKFERKRES